MNKSFFHIVLFLIPLSLFGQHSYSVLNKKEIKIGEPFILSYFVKSPNPIQKIDFSPAKKELKAFVSDKSHADSIYPLEILERFNDTLFKDSNQFIWKGTYKLTGWDSAYVIIPPDSIHINDSLFVFNPQLISINSPKVIKGKPIYDINALFTKTKKHNLFFEFLRNNWWWLAALLLILLSLVYFILKKSGKKEIIIQKSLLELTLEQIQSLEDLKGYETNLKEYYFELSQILRGFLAKHYHHAILDKTTKEVALILKKQEVSKNTIITIKTLLTQSDMVKFAKSKPTTEDAKVVTETAREIVIKITASKEESSKFKKE